jgi:AcrR family transcriptional regulator
MAKKAGGNPADEPAPEEGDLTWRELAVARSLDSARTRAENRVQRFLDAALELMNETETGGEFTVQEVVERSGQSLRSFYQYFGGKHELLLALFEETVRSTTEALAKKLATEKDPLERVHRFVLEYYAMCRAPKGRASARGVAPTMVDFAQQLLTAHPKEAARAFTPLVSLFGELLDEAKAAGVLRSNLRSERVAGVVLEAIMFNVFSSTIARVSMRDDDGEELWDLLLHGIAEG